MAVFFGFNLVIDLSPPPLSKEATIAAAPQSSAVAHQTPSHAMLKGEAPSSSSTARREADFGTLPYNMRDVRRQRSGAARSSGGQLESSPPKGERGDADGSPSPLRGLCSRGFSFSYNPLTLKSMASSRRSHSQERGGGGGSIEPLRSPQRQRLASSFASRQSLEGSFRSAQGLTSPTSTGGGEANNSKSRGGAAAIGPSCLVMKKI